MTRFDCATHGTTFANHHSASWGCPPCRVEAKVAKRAARERLRAAYQARRAAEHAAQRALTDQRIEERRERAARRRAERYTARGAHRAEYELRLLALAATRGTLPIRRRLHASSKLPSERDNWRTGARA